MGQLNKEKFGLFVQQLRKERGLTQKELAGRLCLSDKAVSKWERGLSLPDIGLLEPLADILGVSVTELLRGERLERQLLDKGEVEELVIAASRLSREGQEERRAAKRRWKTRWGLSAAASCAVSAVVLLSLFRAGREAAETGVWVVETLCLVFGFWVCFLVEEDLPAYYDQYKLSSYSQGPFRMNLPGVCFNNRNWPHMVAVMRRWFTLTPVIFPPVLRLLAAVAPPAWGTLWALAPTLAASLGFMIPLVWVGKKYE